MNLAFHKRGRVLSMFPFTLIQNSYLQFIRTRNISTHFKGAAEKCHFCCSFFNEMPLKTVLLFYSSYSLLTKSPNKRSNHRFIYPFAVYLLLAEQKNDPSAFLCVQTLSLFIKTRICSCKIVKSLHLQNTTQIR